MKYSYIVGQTEYQGERVAFTYNHLPKGWGASERRDWVKSHYTIGDLIQVSYENKSPENSVLEPGVLESSYIYTLLLVGVLIILFGYGFLSAILMKPRQS